MRLPCFLGVGLMRWTDRDGVEWTPASAIGHGALFVVMVLAMLVLDVAEWVARKVEGWLAAR